RLILPAGHALVRADYRGLHSLVRHEPELHPGERQVWRSAPARAATRARAARANTAGVPATRARTTAAHATRARAAGARAAGARAPAATRGPPAGAPAARGPAVRAPASGVSSAGRARVARCPGLTRGGRLSRGPSRRAGAGRPVVHEHAFLVAEQRVARDQERDGPCRDPGSGASHHWRRSRHPTEAPRRASR